MSRSLQFKNPELTKDLKDLKDPKNPEALKDLNNLNYLKNPAGPKVIPAPGWVCIYAKK